MMTIWGSCAFGPAQVKSRAPPPTPVRHYYEPSLSTGGKAERSNLNVFPLSLLYVYLGTHI